jgi:hypothetical protein
MWIIFSAVVWLLVAGCGGPRPMLAPSPKLQEAGEAQAQDDIRECISLADRSTAMSETERTAQESAAIPGRMAGGTRVPGGGVIEGPPRSTAPGPIASPAWKAAVERCLKERGYAVESWK